MNLYHKRGEDYSGPFKQYSIKRQDKLVWKEFELFLESFPLALSVGTNKSLTLLFTARKRSEIHFPTIQWEKIAPLSFEPMMDQRLLSLERMLKDQQESHHQQLALFLAANAALCQENATLHNTATIPCHGNSAVPHSPARSEPTNNYSPPPLGIILLSIILGRFELLPLSEI